MSDSSRSGGLAEYRGCRVRELLDRDLRRFAEKPGAFDLRQIRKAAIGIAAHHFHRWTGDRKRRERFREIASVLDGAIVFAPTVQNNLNPMLPLAEEFSRRGMRCVFILPRHTREWQHRDTLRKQYDVIDIDRVPRTWSREAESAMRTWKRELARPQDVDPRIPGNLRARMAFRLTMEQEAREFLAVTEGLDRLLATGRPRMLLASRPKRLVPLSVILAANRNKVPATFLTHTLWFRRLDNLYRLFDLRSFDQAVFYTRPCADVAGKRNSALATIVSGWPVPSEPEPVSDLRPAGRFVIGHPAITDPETVREVALTVAGPGHDLYVKGRPAGGDGKVLRDVAAECQNTCVFEHKEMDLDRFLASIDVMVCGRSSVGLDAAARGIPVIRYYGTRERQAVDALPYAIELGDIALWSAETAEELEALISRITEQGREAVAEHARQQREKYHSLIPPYDAERVVNALLGDETRSRVA